jgi:hypothetical protein
MDRIIQEGNYVLELLLLLCVEITLQLHLALPPSF